MRPRIGLRPLAGQGRRHFRLVAGRLQRGANGHHNAARIGWLLLLLLLGLGNRQTGPVRGRRRQCILLQIGADTRVLPCLLQAGLAVRQRRASLVAADGMTLRPVEIGRAVRLWRGQAQDGSISLCVAFDRCTVCVSVCVCVALDDDSPLLFLILPHAPHDTLRNKEATRGNMWHCLRSCPSYYAALDIDCLASCSQISLSVALTLCLSPKVSP